MKETLWDGESAASLEAHLRVPRVDLHAEVDSTQDLAHALAEQGAPSGTMVLADAQRAGRGRMGRSWSSPPGQGVWCTTIARPSDRKALDVLSLRVGLLLAESLDGLAGAMVGVKWPNDLRLGRGKLGGILVEARWSGSTLGWVAIGIGVNVAPPAAVEHAVGLPPETPRVKVLEAAVHAITAASASRDWLSDDEVRRYRARDALAGCRIVSPATGTVIGITPTGAVIVENAQGVHTEHRSGTIRLAEEQ